MNKKLTKSLVFVLVLAAALIALGTGVFAADDPVAKIGDTEYYTLAAAVAAAQNGDTITLLKDDNVSLTNGQEIEIRDKSITITGAVDSNGEPLYTIYGTPTNNGYNDIFIAGSGDVAISNVKIAQFGNQKATASGHAPIWVSTSNTGAVTLDNVVISDFNRTGLYIGGGTFAVTNCNIDCSKSTDYGSVMTKGIEVHGTATGTISGTTISGASSTYDQWTTAGIEIYGNGDIAVTDTTITGLTSGIATSDVGYDASLMPNDTGAANVTITNCTINVSGDALWVDSNDALLDVKSGTYTGDISVEPEKDGAISISGGTFSSKPDEAYLAEGTMAVKNGDKWTVGQAADVAVAKIGDRYYASLAEAVDAVPADGTETTITILKDQTIEVTGYAITVASGKNVVLDLNGYQVVGTCTESGTSALIRNQGTLTITDSGNGGKLIGGADPTWTWDGSDDYSSSYASNLIRNEGTLTVNGGTLYNASSGSAAYAIDNYDSGKVTINGGTVDAKKASAIRMFYNNGGKLEVTDGTVGHYNGDDDCSYMGIQVMAGTNADVTVSGGTIAGTYALYSNGTGDSSVNISGGTFDGYVGFGSGGPDDIAISGGTFLDWAGTWGEQTGFISGGTFAEEPDEEYIADGYMAVKQGDVWIVGPAEEVAVAKIGNTLYASLAKAVAAAAAAAQNGDTITLLKDSTENVTIDKQGSVITLDLNGKALTGYLDIYNADVTVKNGTVNGTIWMNGFTAANEGTSNLTLAADATINSDYGIILYQDSTGTKGYGSTINVNGTVNGCIFVMGNIKEGDSVININDGAKVTNNDDVAIALNGKATLNIYEGAAVTGATGVEIRAGELNITGGTITATGDFSEAANGNGTTVNGAAVAVSQHTTNLPIAVNISGGTLTGAKSLYEVDLQDDTTEGVTISVTDGAFNGAVASENVTGFLSGGTYSSEPDASYIVPGKVAVQDGNMWKIGTLDDAFVVTFVPTGAVTALTGLVDAEVGGTVTVDVKMKNNSSSAIDVVSFMYVLEMDSNLTAASIAESDATSNGTLTLDTSIQSGKKIINYDAQSNSGLISFAGGAEITVGTLTLKVAASPNNTKAYGDTMAIGMEENPDKNSILDANGIDEFTPTSESGQVELVTKYTITYDANGGNIDPATQEVGYKVAPTPATPTKDGFTFAGWKDADGNLYAPGTALPVATAAATYTATWNFDGNVVFVDYAYAASGDKLMLVGYDAAPTQTALYDGKALFWTDDSKYTALLATDTKTYGKAYLYIVPGAVTTADVYPKLTFSGDTSANIKIDRDCDVNLNDKINAGDWGLVDNLLAQRQSAATVNMRLEADTYLVDNTTANKFGNIEDIAKIITEANNF